MTILEFIRKNSLMVLIVIVAVGAGLVMMDYSGKGSAFSRDFYIRVDDVGYSYPEAAALGENGKQYLSSLISATGELTEHLDADGNGTIDSAEQPAAIAWQQEHPEVFQSLNDLRSVYAAWHYGVAKDGEVNVAINRAMLQAEADRLGLHPSEEQIDAYLRSLPAFKKEDGSFNLDLYRRLAGYRHGNVSRVHEEALRGVVADIIIWDALQKMVSDNIAFNTKAQTTYLDAISQNISGITAFIPSSAIPAAPDPTEEELRAYWEQHKENYKSDEQRIISVYTLTPGEGSNTENLLATADEILQELSLANGQGLDGILDRASKNPQYEPFTYLQADGSTLQSYELATQQELAERLQDTVNDNGKDVPLAAIAFSEVENVATPEIYQSAKANGTADRLVAIRQIRGFYTTADGKLKLVRIEAVKPPTVLDYEEAKDRALTDCRKERADNALKCKAQEIYEQIQKNLGEKGLRNAFEIASTSGGAVEDFGPLAMGQLNTVLPTGVSDADLIGTPSGKLAPLATLPNGARITAVSRRTVEKSPSATMRRQLMELPMQNDQLRAEMMQEWQNAGFSRFNVQLSSSVRTVQNSGEE